MTTLSSPEIEECEMTQNIFQHPPHLPLIRARRSWRRISRGWGRRRRTWKSAGRTLLHVDIMDGHFVPNLTMGPDIVMALARSCKLMQDVHLMVSNPENFIESFAKAGAGSMTFHIEVTPGQQAVDMIKRIHDMGCTAGVSLNPQTPVETLKDVMGLADLILVMSVHPGFTGQAFMPEMLDKVRFLRHELGPQQRLEIDGGIGIRTAHQALEAGADVLVAGAAVFRNPERAQTIKLLRGDYPK